MRRYAFATVFALVIVSGGLRPPLAKAGPYDDLLKHTSANTNTLVLIDVKGAFASPLARAEKWAEKIQVGHHGALGFVPPDAEVVVIAGEVNFSTLVRDFQIGLVKVRNVPSMKELAAREGGTPDEIAGRLAVLSPRDVYFTTFSGSELVALYPADRQYVARYMRAAMAAKEPPLSAYLKRAAAKADANTVTIAMDLEDAVDKTILKLSLPSSPAVVKAKGVDVNLLATLMASVKGMTVAIKVADAVSASITVEFGGDPSRFKRTLPDLFRELIEGQGIAIDGFEGWAAAFTDTTMTLSGKLTTADLKRIISLFAFPHPPGEADPAVKGGEPSAAMTKRYLAAVDTILADLRKLRDTPNYEKTATWHDKAAAQIEQLNEQGVDPLAVNAAFEASKRLRAIASSLRGVPIDVDALASQQYYSSRPQLGVMPGGWWGWQPIIFGPTQVQTNIPEIQAKMAKVIADDKKRRLETWSKIESILMDARRQLSAKYKVDF
jgi:hypothetical protein